MRHIRYPQVRVQLRSQSRLAAVAAVRHELRRAGIPTDEIDRFSEEALDEGLDHVWDVCDAWVDTISDENDEG